MASNIGDIVATASLDISPFRSNMGQLKTYLKGVDSSLKAMETNFKGAGKNVSNLKQLMNQTGQAIAGYQKALQTRTERYEKLKANIGDVSNATAEQKKQLLDAQSAVISTAGRIAELTNRYQELAKAIRQTYIDESPFTKFGNAAIEMGNKWQKVGSSISGFGSALTKGVTVPIVAGAGLALKAAIDYESAFAGVKKTVDETATVSYAKLSDGIRQMAKELPASAVEIANVAEVAGQLGIKTEDILKFSRTMIDMGESTNLSSEEAATAIAKIANIMGLTSDEYSRFGAAVVDLGNNYATTERDIVEMTNRLAAGGRLAGLTTPDILGLATAMSSVGIEAEAGGTAMTQTLTAIGKAVSLTGEGAAEKLELIANTAGMTSEQFQQAWKEKPVQALQAFIKGLENAHKSGENVNGILDDLGMKGIRQSNMLKSLALASDKMTGAVEKSNEAWRKNTALTDEANKRYETTESQLKMFKNELTDIAIEFGGPLLKALRSGLDAVKPWISDLADLAKKFSSLSTEQQQNIIYWGLLAAGIGPALKILGGGISTIGGVMKAVGGLSRGIGILSGSFKAFRDAGSILGGFKAAAGAIGGVETAAAGAASSTGLLAGAVGLLGNPITWGVILGGAALVAIGMYAQSVQDARKRTEEWGTEVSKKQAVALETFKGKVDEAKRAMVDFGTGVGDVDKVTASVQKLADEIGKLADKQTKDKVNIAKSLGLSDETVAALEQNGQKIKDNVNQMSSEIGSIYRNASEQHRQLTAEEKAIVTANMNEMIDTQLSLMEFSGKERVKITQAINGELDGLNKTQLKKARETLEGWIKEENKSYKEQKENYKKLLADLKGTDEATLAARKEIKQKLQDLEAEHTAKMEEYGKRWVAIEQKLTEDALKNSTPEARKAILNQIRKMAEELGISYDEMAQKATAATSKIQEQSSLWAQTTKESSEAQRTANVQWNSMVWDLKEGKLKTNAVEEVQKALQAEGGWDAMQFILKEAKLETNALLMIGEALVANEQWESLSPQEKELVVQGQKAISAILDSKELLTTWNALPSDIKEILGRNESFMGSAEAATNALNNWNKLLPAEKDIIARDLASPDVKVVQGAIDRLTGKTIPLEAKDDTGAAIESALYSVNSVHQNAPIPIDAVDNTKPSVDSSLEAINSVKQMGPVSIEAVNNTLGEVLSAQQTMDSLTDVTRALNGENLTQIEKDRAQETLDSLMDVTRQLLASDATGPEKEAAQQTLNSLQDVTRFLKGENLTGQPKEDAQRLMNSLQDVTRNLHAVNQTQGPSRDASNTINSVKQNSPVSIQANNNAWGGVNAALGALGALPGVRFIDIITRTFTQKHAKGTDFHSGGLATVNDQRGVLYKELVTLPDGTSFIPEGRNVTLPLPRGSKVLKAGLTRNLMTSLGIPNYANGIGFENTKISHLSRRIKDINEHSAQYDDRRVVQLLAEIARLTSEKEPKDPQTGDVNYTLNLNGSGREDFFTPENMKRLMRELAYYTNGEGGRLA